MSKRRLKRPKFIKDLEKKKTANLAKKTDTKKVNDKSKGKKILLVILLILTILLVLGIIFFIYIALSAGKFDPNKLYTKEASVLYDKDGNQFAKLGSEMREKIKYKQLSEEMINAIVATEDSRFFVHNGFDLPRFLKAAAGQALGQNAGGASTLTMQISKNQFTSTNATGLAGIKRKFTDIYTAIFLIEPHYSKQEIMEFYVNSYYLGSGAYGIEQAAKTYFNKSAKDLNVAESAMIAGLFQSPVAYDPNINPERTEARRQTVLKLMKRHGYITDEEYNIAKDMTVDKIVIKGNSATTDYAKYQGFVDTVASQVQKKTGYDPYSYSMKIYTTMDKDKQDKINAIMDGESFKWENDKVDAGIIALDTKNGHIVAVGAGRNRQGAKSFNNATMIKNQIGSTAKPLYDYGPAIEYLGWNTAHPLIDAPYTYSDGTEINNWDGKYKGIITARAALVDSRNIPALKTFQSVNNSDILNFVKKLGLSPEVSNGRIHEAHAIGGYNGESPLTLAGAYAAFGNKGTYNEPLSYTKVVFDKNNKIEEPKAKVNKVMGEDTAYMVSDMLVDTGQSALGRYSNINGAQYAAKTGTTNFDEATMKARHLPSNAVNDLWVAGYNPDYAIAVWYGYQKPSASGYNRFGSSQNSRLFQAVAKNFFKSSSKFEKPSSVEEVTIESNTGNPMLPSANTPDSAKTKELFKKSAKPTEVSNRFNTLSNVTNLTSKVTGTAVSLSWKGIGTPDGLNSSYWSAIVNKAFKNANDQKTYLNYVMSYNQSVLGSVIYNVYLKQGGSLTKLTATTNETVTVPLPRTSSPTYVVKASYTTFTGAESSGTETTVKYEAEDETEATITVDEPTVTATGTFDDSPNPITVTKDGEDITSDCTITATYTKDGQSMGSYNNITFNTPGTYVITYAVKYEGQTLGTKTKTVTLN